MKLATLDDRYEKLFHLLGELRGAATHHLVILFFQGSSRTAQVTVRAAQQHLKQLVERGYLLRASLPDSRQTVFQLTDKARLAFPSVAQSFTDQVRKPLTDDVACWAWQRSAPWASLVADGYSVGNGVTHLLAVRRSLIDRLRVTVARSRAAALDEIRRAKELQPFTKWVCPACAWSTELNGVPAAKECPRCAALLKQRAIEQPWRCRRCGLVEESFRESHMTTEGITCDGRLKPHRYLPYDVAFRHVEGQPPDVRLLLVDNPMRSVESQLLDLPLRFLEQRKLDVIIRPSDDDTVYDLNASAYLMRGHRFRALCSAFQPHDNPRMYPFWVAAEVITYRPEVVLRVVKTGKKK